MIWPQYERSRAALMQAQKDYRDITDLEAELFQRTQPSSVSTDKDAVSTGGGEGSDTIDAYLIRKEKLQLDERIASAEQIVDRMKKRLETDRQLLELSTDPEDKVYMQRFVLGKKRIEMVTATGFSEAKIKRVLHKIAKSLSNSESEP